MGVEASLAIGLARMAGSTPEILVDNYEQLLQIKGLHQIVTGAALEGVSGSLDRRIGCHHDDRYVLDLVEQYQTWHIGHHDIAKDKINVLSVQDLQPRLRTVSSKDLEPLGAQQLFQRITQPVFIVNNEETVIRT